MQPLCLFFVALMFASGNALLYFNYFFFKDTIWVIMEVKFSMK